MIQGHDATIFIDLNGNVIEGHGVRSPHYVLMMSTGLEDVNGREIFQGDLVEQFGQVYQVVWHFGGTWLWDRERQEHKLIHENKCKVVGHIYERANFHERSDEDGG